MRLVIEHVGGRKMLIGLAAIVGLVVLSVGGDLPTADAAAAIWKIVVAVAGGIALEDGLSRRNARTTNH